MKTLYRLAAAALASVSLMLVVPLTATAATAIEYGLIVV